MLNSSEIAGIHSLMCSRLMMACVGGPFQNGGRSESFRIIF